MVTKPLQKVNNKLDAWAVERGLIFFPFSEHDILKKEKEKQGTNENFTKKQNHIIQEKSVVFGDDPKQQIKLKKTY